MQRLGKLQASIGEDWTDVKRHSFEKSFQELASDTAVSHVRRGCHHELVGSVNGAKETELAFGRSKFVDVQIEEPNRVPLEPLTDGLVFVHIRQAKDAVPLEKSMTRRACEMSYHRLQRVETVIQRVQGLMRDGENHCFALPTENHGPRLPMPSFPILQPLPLAPPGTRLHVDAIYSRLSAAVEACGRCIAARMACVVVAQPWLLFPIWRPRTTTSESNHQTRRPST